MGLQDVQSGSTAVETWFWLALKDLQNLKGAPNYIVYHFPVRMGIWPRGRATLMALCGRIDPAGLQGSGPCRDMAALSPRAG